MARVAHGNRGTRPLLQENAELRKSVKVTFSDAVADDRDERKFKIPLYNVWALAIDRNSAHGFQMSAKDKAKMAKRF